MTTTFLNGKHYIGGEWRTHSTGCVVFNPSTEEVIGSVPIAGHRDLDDAVDAAECAFRVWGDNSRWSWVRRAAVMNEVVQLVEAHQKEIAYLVARESGKHLDEANADVVEGIHMLQYCAGRGRHPIGHKIASEISEKESETYLDPRGVCTVITPWNFPFAIPTWLIGPALVSGNTVVFKPSEETPLSGQFLVDLFHQVAEKHRVPAGALNLVHGLGDQGEYLVRHAGTIGQLFTGSQAVGRKVRRICAEHPNKFAVCELGGKNSLIIMSDARMDLAVAAAVLSAYKTAHQRCVSADLLIVDEKIEPEFTAQFLAATDRVRFGDPFDEAMFAGPLINRKAVYKFNMHGASVKSEGAEVLRWHEADGASNFVRPNVFRMPYRPHTFTLRQEAFTPNVVIVPVRDFEEAVHVANDNDGTLSAAIITEDYRLHREFKLRVKSGLKYVNLPTIGAEIHLPFGGQRGSGTGAPSAAWLFHHLCHETAYTVNYGDEIKLAQGLSAEIAGDNEKSSDISER